MSLYFDYIKFVADETLAMRVTEIAGKSRRLAS